MKTKANLIVRTVLAAAVTFGSGMAAAEQPFVSNFLRGSVFEAASQDSGIDALLLYAIAVTESNRAHGQGMAGPDPLAIRACGQAHYPKTRELAEQKLKEIMSSGCTNVDVGLMQVNLRWNGSRVDSPFLLFDAQINANTGSKILYEAMQSSPHDIRTAIARYHNWSMPEVGGAYADTVLSLYAALKRNTI